MKNVFASITFRSASIIFILLQLSACTSGPRQVNASLPLVTSSLEQPDKEMIPNQYWSILSDDSQSRLTHDQYQISLGEIYISALGRSCRELVIKDKNNEIKKRIACENHFLNKKNQENKAWFLEKVIIESSSFVEL